MAPESMHPDGRPSPVTLFTELHTHCRHIVCYIDGDQNGLPFSIVIGQASLNQQPEPLALQFEKFLDPHAIAKPLAGRPDQSDGSAGSFRIHSAKRQRRNPRHRLAVDKPLPNGAIPRPPRQTTALRPVRPPATGYLRQAALHRPAPRPALARHQGLHRLVSWPLATMGAASTGRILKIYLVFNR